MKRISILFTIFIIAVIILADRGSLPHWVRALYDFPNGDKLGHFALFGLLNFFLARALLSTFPSRPKGWVTISISLILALLIAAEEWSQQFFATRTFDLLDLLASYVGLVVGGWAAQRQSYGQPSK
ncbi:MAG: VanZ family protein [Chloroflexi bacterium]|nr:VanZ family protein [Chloroflexota bacterium]